MEKLRIECDGDGWRFAFRSDFPFRYKMGNSIHYDHISILVGSLAVALHTAAGFKYFHVDCGFYRSRSIQRKPNDFTPAGAPSFHPA
ncbi:MAG: hypothetical protein QOF64_1575, partial [Candidatus Binatota bacterium]|nr:hypothetical protein [Candidatus Binatota bacterium]